MMVGGGISTRSFASEKKGAWIARKKKRGKDADLIALVHSSEASDPQLHGLKHVMTFADFCDFVTSFNREECMIGDCGR